MLKPPDSFRFSVQVSELGLRKSRNYLAPEWNRVPGFGREISPSAGDHLYCVSYDIAVDFCLPAKAHGFVIVHSAKLSMRQRAGKQNRGNERGRKSGGLFRVHAK